MGNCGVLTGIDCPRPEGGFMRRGSAEDVRTIVRVRKTKKSAEEEEAGKGSRMD